MSCDEFQTFAVLVAGRCTMMEPRQTWVMAEQWLRGAASRWSGTLEAAIRVGAILDVGVVILACAHKIGFALEVIEPTALCRFQV
jgi:hypothetical protein